jgi:hypothetical protein
MELEMLSSSSCVEGGVEGERRKLVPFERRARSAGSLTSLRDVEVTWPEFGSKKGLKHGRWQEQGVEAKRLSSEKGDLFMDV